MFLRDCWHDLVVRKEEEKMRKEGLVGVKDGREMTAVGRRGSIGGEGGARVVTGKTVEPLETEKVPNERSSPDKSEVDNGSPSASNETPSASSSASPEPQQPTTKTPPTSDSPTPTLLKPVSKFTKTFPTASLVISRLPLQLIPFAFSMFILVEALSYTGWIRVFATWWTAWVNVGGLPGAIWLMGMISVLGCNAFGTNIGATVLLSRTSPVITGGVADDQGSCNIGGLMRGLFRIGSCMDRCSLWRWGLTSVPTLSCKPIPSSFSFNSRHVRNVDLG
jgi:hypothetical protein